MLYTVWRLFFVLFLQDCSHRAVELSDDETNDEEDQTEDEEEDEDEESLEEEKGKCEKQDDEKEPVETTEQQTVPQVNLKGHRLHFFAHPIKILR